MSYNNYIWCKYLAYLSEEAADLFSHVLTWPIEALNTLIERCKKIQTGEC